MDCSPLGSSVSGVSQGSILECFAISFSRGSSQPRDQTHVSCKASEFFTTEPPGKPIILLYASGYAFSKVCRRFIYINKAYCFVVLSCSSFIWLCYQGDAGLIEWVRKSSIFSKSLRIISVNYSLNVGSFHHWKYLVLVFIIGKFLMTDSNSAFLKICSDFVFISWIKLGSFSVSRNFSMSYVYLRCWHTIIHIIVLESFSFIYVRSFEISNITCDCNNLSLFSFFLVIVIKDLSVCWFLSRTSLVSVHLSITFCSPIFMADLIFIVYSLVLVLDLICFSFLHP